MDANTYEVYMGELMNKKEIYYVPANRAWYIKDGEVSSGVNFVGQTYKEDWNELYTVVDMPAYNNFFPY